MHLKSRPENCWFFLPHSALYYKLQNSRTIVSVTVKLQRAQSPCPCTNLVPRPSALRLSQLGLRMSNFSCIIIKITIVFLALSKLTPFIYIWWWFQKRSTLPQGEKVCRPEGRRIASEGGREGGVTSHFLCGGGIDVFWNNPFVHCLTMSTLAKMPTVKNKYRMKLKRMSHQREIQNITRCRHLKSTRDNECKNVLISIA